MEDIKRPQNVIVFYEENIFQKILCQYIEKGIKGRQIALSLVPSLDTLFERISQGLVDVLLTEFHYLYGNKAWDHAANKKFKQLCLEHHVRRGLLVADNNPWLMRRIVEMEFEAAVSMNDDISELNKAIDYILRAKEATPFVSSHLRASLSAARKRADTLSSREWEVVYLVAQGYSISEIAARKSRALSTVATQKHNAMKKLNVSNNSELIKYIHTAGMLK
ncbi:LuxR C-terminal-related transcriptional regulator [Tenebrionibacter intestinalis]|jgi:two-component system capsular synthesis response regulator RcsB|uniref:Response regulator transcription factor n=2 Tax=Tenebrionibacter/Tenebrionicola group TaxID=2969848 RepID=A0A8K0V0J8_9ENTR|nr:LuxR C-terminal-related transcriptional regulator [Tenebrionibacter intestinalis]MBK4715104.1 response regulator transcription factor [Tenebrionibacter intestinalis]MBV5096236.1 response regulator transcription factor [Tenebrionicola larvae]